MGRRDLSAYKPRPRVNVLAFMTALAWRARNSILFEAYLAELLNEILFGPRVRTIN